MPASWYDKVLPMMLSESLPPWSVSVPAIAVKSAMGLPPPIACMGDHAQGDYDKGSVGRGGPSAGQLQLPPSRAGRERLGQVHRQQGELLRRPAHRVRRAIRLGRV